MQRVAHLVATLGRDAVPVVVGHVQVVDEVNELIARRITGLTGAQQGVRDEHVGLVDTVGRIG